MNQASGGSVEYRCRTGFRDEVNSHCEGGATRTRNFNEPVRIEITVHEPLQELVSFGLLDTFTIFLDYIPWFYTTFIGISLGSIGRSLDHRQKQNLYARTHSLPPQPVNFLANLGYSRNLEFIPGGF